MPEQFGSLVATVEGIKAAVEDRRRVTGDSIPSWGFGEREIQLSDSPPRIVFVPQQGTVTGAGGGRGAGKTFVTNPWSLWTRTVNVDAHVWADDESAMEKLATDLVIGIDAVAHGAYRMTGEHWNTAGIGNAGNVLIVSFSIDIPWLQAALAVARATSQTINSEFVNGNG